MTAVRWLAWLAIGLATAAAQEVDSEESRKVLGSSVVTSVSVIMDHGNGTKTYITDAAGQPIDQTDGAVGSPVDLLNPDRYEFYTFDETGDLVKKLMTLDQIKGLLANGDGETLDGPSESPTFFHESLSSDDSDLEPNMRQGVHNVVASVQNVLRSELQATKSRPKVPQVQARPPLNIPDSISSWSMLFPAIISDDEALELANDSGNSVSDPIDGGDRLPAPSNQEKTEIKLATEDTKTQENEAVTGKPTAVPPIIHFLEIHSVPAKNPTKTPMSPSTTPAVASTSNPPTTTDKPTSPVNPIQEMSASISSLLSQVTDEKIAAETNKVIASETSSTTQSVPTKSSEKTPIAKKPAIKPDSSNIQTVTKKAPSAQKKPESNGSANSKPNKPIQSTATKINIKTENSTQKNNNDSSKKPTDTVVSLVTTSKPLPSSVKNKPKPLNTSTKQKIQVTTITPSALKKNNGTTPGSTTPTTVRVPTPPKKTSKPPASVNKIDSDHLEAHGSEDVVKVANKPSQLPQASNQVKPNNQTPAQNESVSNATTNKTVSSSTKPQDSHDHHDCPDSHKSPSSSELKNEESLEVAASTNLNNDAKPTTTKSPVLQQVKLVPKPPQKSKPTVNKTKVSEDVKITTYKPSTSHPFTTKPSTNKISTTTEKANDNKITSESKIHEVNSSLLDIKEHVVSKPNSQALVQEKIHSISNKNNDNKVSNYESAASNTNETTVPVKIQINETKNSPVSGVNSTESIDHKTEVECKHNKNHTSIQDKISEEPAASDKEEVKLTTDAFEPTTEVTLDDRSSETTTEFAKEEPTEITDDLFTTTEQPEEKSTDLPETTTLNMPGMDFIQEGISAVANILLEAVNGPVDQQLPLPTIPLSESASNIVQSPPVKGEVKHASSFDDLEMTTDDGDLKTTVAVSSTTEKEKLIYFTTTDPPVTETETPTTDPTVIEILKISDDTEQTTDAYTTPRTEEITTEPTVEENKESSESKVVSTSVASNQTLPTKESKVETAYETAEGLPCNHTTSKQNSTKEYPTVSSSEKDSTETKDHLEPAQSVISEVNNSGNAITTTTGASIAASTQKDSVKDENLDLKAAQKPIPTKYTQKYPNLQNVYRPIQDPPLSPPSAVELHPAPHESMGLEATTAFLADDVRRFSDLCNELAFRMWTSITGKGSISSRSLVLSPFATTSLLAMVFLGARGPTSGQMNDILRLDDMVTFNPHQVLQNITESVLNSRNYGVTNAAFVRELYSDKLKGKILDFYKERAQQYYDGHVEEISFNVIGDILRRRTNLLVKRQTLGRIPEYMRGSTLSLRPPLAAFSANIFQTDCDLASTEGRDGEMYFVVRPSTRQRRLVPVPAAVWRTGFLAGYEPGLDATAVALGTDSVVSTILVLPGQQGQVAPGDGLTRLEQRLIETSYRRGGWTRLLRSLLPRPGLELQVPRFSHRSVLNVTSTLQRMGLKDLFNENKADLRGLNGLSNDLHLSDMVQVNTFSTCGDDTIGARHHIETYPVSAQRMGRDDPELYPRPQDLDDPDVSKVPLNLRQRQARLPDSPRLRFDRPFLYMVRHNPTGMILHMGRFNPRLLP